MASAVGGLPEWSQPGFVPFAEVEGVTELTLEVLERLGFARATPVQAATIPLFSAYKDVAVDACTGSGKTLAFIIPITEKLRGLDEPLKPRQVGAIIISPTRELARQTHAVAQEFLATVPGLSSMLLVGGSDPEEDVASFERDGPQVLVGTPGRLWDLLQRGVADCRRLEVLVLDEADRLLDMGFRGHLDSIMAQLPKQRRTGLFSATQTDAVEALARAGLRNPVRVNVAVTQPAAASQHAAGAGSSKLRGSGAEAGEGLAKPLQQQRTPSGLSIGYRVLESDAKFNHLVQFLQEHRGEKSIIYFLTCAAVDFHAVALARLPETRKLAVSALHGRMKQAAREKTLAAFTEQPAAVLLCTDVAARGLDVPDVAWILQYDPPQDPDAFIHRVGRTARMGRSGNALAYLLPHETEYVEFLQLRKVPLQEAPPLPQPPPDALSRVRRAAETDREVLDKGTKAFVSYVRGYKEHHCRFIFRLPDLDLGRLATAFALLRLPGMPEVKKAPAEKLAAFVPSDVDPATVKFKDKVREKQRKANAAASAAAAAAKKEERIAERDRRAAAEAAPRLPAQKRRQLEERYDAKELFDDYRLLKKLKKGKISQREFDVGAGLSNSEDEDEDQETVSRNSDANGDSPVLGPVKVRKATSGDPGSLSGSLMAGNAKKKKRFKTGALGGGKASILAAQLAKKAKKAKRRQKQGAQLGAIKGS